MWFWSGSWNCIADMASSYIVYKPARTVTFNVNCWHQHTPTHAFEFYALLIVVLASFKMHSLALMQRCESQAFSNSKPALINLWISKRLGAVFAFLLVIFVFSAWLLSSIFSAPSKENITQRDLNNFHPLFVHLLHIFFIFLFRFQLDVFLSPAAALRCTYIYFFSMFPQNVYVCTLGIIEKRKCSGFSMWKH